MITHVRCDNRRRAGGGRGEGGGRARAGGWERRPVKIFRGRQKLEEGDNNYM